MNKFLKYALAAGIVLACSVEAKAQQGQQRQVYNTNRVYNNTTVYNNTVYRNNNGYGYGYGYNNGVGRWPGSGPYDSAIAVTAIAAGASVINNLVNSAQPRYQVYQPAPAVVYQQPQVVYAPAPQQVVVQQQPQTVVVLQPAYPNLQGACQSYITGQNPQGGNVYVSTCN